MTGVSTDISLQSERGNCSLVLAYFFKAPCEIILLDTIQLTFQGFIRASRTNQIFKFLTIILLCCIFLVHDLEYNLKMPRSTTFQV